MKSSGEAKLLLIMALFVLLGGGALVLLNRSAQAPPNPVSSPTPTPAPWNAARFDAIVQTARHSKGDPKARFTLVEFGDFECPPCRRAYNNVLVKREPQIPIHYIFYNFPLVNLHPNARPSAIAAEAAAKQGKFWPVFDALFKGEESDLSKEALHEIALRAGLNMDTFEQDIKDPATEALVDADQKIGAANGVSSTPTLVLRDSKTGKFYQVTGGWEIDSLLATLTGKPVVSTPPPSAGQLPGTNPAGP